jgi:hypothetical protein
MPTLSEYEAMLRERLDRVGSAPRAQLLHVLLLPDFASGCCENRSAARSV